VRNILIDAGPLIALFDRSDQYHRKAIGFMRSFEGILWTTWPVVTEVMHMLDFNPKVQLDFMTWVDRGAIQFFPIGQDHLGRLIRFIQLYDDVPMDLADASLIVASEELGYKEIASIDSDFYIYRDIRKQYLNNVFM